MRRNNNVREQSRKKELTKVEEAKLIAELIEWLEAKGLTDECKEKVISSTHFLLYPFSFRRHLSINVS